MWKLKWMEGTASHGFLVRRIGHTPIMTSHSGFLTRSSSDSGSRSLSQASFCAVSISSDVRWRMKTGLPRHLMMTCVGCQLDECHKGDGVMCGAKYTFRNRQGLTFLPSGIVFRSTSTLARASTSADADRLTRKSKTRPCQLESRA